MRQLFLVRHAKSDPAFGSLEDIDRPLNARGYRDAPGMAQVLQKRGLLPDLIVTSPAVRAVTTASIFARELHFPIERVVLDPRLYEARPSMLRQVIAQHTAPTLMLVGHNPAFSDLATDLSGVTIELPTTGVASIRFTSTSWAKAMGEAGDLELFDYPKRHN